MKIKQMITFIPAAGAAVLLMGGLALAEPLPGGTLDPLTIPKYATPLVKPGEMPKSALPVGVDEFGGDYYEIAVREFNQQVLPAPLPETKVWGYGSVNNPETFNYPAYTIEAEYKKPVRVKWINDLVEDPVGCAASINKTTDPACKYLPHFLPIDQTIHWANPPGMSDMPLPPTYTGPVPMVPHLHGAHVTQESDGYPEAWFLPDANNTLGYANVGLKYGDFKSEAEIAYGQVWDPGTAVYQYPNDQRAATLWFHDHSLGMTRVNVYAGPAGFYLIRGGTDDAVTGSLPAGDYEIPLVIQDRSFNEDGSLFYPDNRAFFEGLTVDQLQIPFTPDAMSDIAPIWNPEFFGNTMVVNGRTWPYLEVEARRYRFRVLNGSDSRFFILKLDNNIPIWQIGNDGGFLPEPVKLTTLLLAPAERADIIIDFGEISKGKKVTLQNIGPDEPFGGGTPGVDFDMADPATTGQVMQFRVVKSTVKADPATNPKKLGLPAITAITGEPITRRLSLNELMSMKVFIPVDENGDPVLDDGNLVGTTNPGEGFDAFGPAQAKLGTINEDGSGNPLSWADPITETPIVGATEIWEMYNFTADAHPIHLHQIQFEVVNREFMGEITGPEPGETGFKDTVISYPGDEGDNPGITRVKVKFDLPGLYVWHCHILSHEDNEMMRPLRVLPPQLP
jgi:spore coat protein A, manganese oxidase